MNKTLLMAPGPTSIHGSSYIETAKDQAYHSFDKMFLETYEKATGLYNQIVHSTQSTYILNGEAILGLEAACASLTEKGDRVLCITNGIFGDGFADFVSMYGGEPTIFQTDYKRGIDIDKLSVFLKDNNDFKYATLVHCETPSGMTNDIEKIVALLNEHNIISVVDSVSAVAGEKIRVDEWGIDVLLGGSQKCISYISGLTFVTLSQRAKEAITERKTAINGFYNNLNIMIGAINEGCFPYTQPTQLIHGVIVALENILEKDFEAEHKALAERVRKSIVESGLELYPLDTYSNTVSTIMLPEDIDYESFYQAVKESGAIIAGGFGFLDNKIFRIGHMGDQCNENKIKDLMYILDEAFEKLNVKLDKPLHKTFK